MPRRRNDSIVIRAGLAVMTATLCMAGTAHAQSAYIGASALADIARFGTRGGIGGAASGEAFGAAVRVGTSITDRWGLDVEFARPGEIEQQAAFALARALPATTARRMPSPMGSMPGTPGRAVPVGRGSFVPNVPLLRNVQATTTNRFSTLTVMPWIRQSLGSRADIVYLGGIAFVRTERAGSVGLGRVGGIFGDVRGTGGLGQQTIAYGAAPAVGLDFRVSMTDHVRFVPGVRLLVVDAGARSGWISRPSLGLLWTF